MLPVVHSGFNENTTTQISVCIVDVERFSYCQQLLICYVTKMNKPARLKFQVFKFILKDMAG